MFLLYERGIDGVNVGRKVVQGCSFLLKRYLCDNPLLEICVKGVVEWWCLSGGGGNRFRRGPEIQVYYVPLACQKSRLAVSLCH